MTDQPEKCKFCGRAVIRGLGCCGAREVEEVAEDGYYVSARLYRKGDRWYADYHATCAVTKEIVAGKTNHWDNRADAWRDIKTWVERSLREKIKASPTNILRCAPRLALMDEK